MQCNYTITRSNACFEQINLLLIMVVSYGIALEAKSGKFSDHNPGDFLALECNHFKNFQLKLPLYGPLECRLTNQTPELICINITKITSKKPSYKKSIPSSDVIFSIIPFIFVTFYEFNKENIYRIFGNPNLPRNHLNWPSSWRMGWVIRNALSHNQRIQVNNLDILPITWKGLTVSSENNGQMLIENNIGFGDIVILLLEMDREISKLLD